MTGPVNINGLFGIIFSLYEYLTHYLSENDANDTVYDFYTLLTSGRFCQYNHNILSNA